MLLDSLDKCLGQTAVESEVLVKLTIDFFEAESLCSGGATPMVMQVVVGGFVLCTGKSVDT
jgi:hypothetical protein